MRKTVIKCGLSVKEINRAIKEIEKYKKDILEKTTQLREKVAERIETLSRSGFAGAIVDDLLPDSGGQRKAEVEVSLTNNGDVSVVIAKGEDAIWVEFGAGVFHNGSAGSSPNPYGNDLGFKIGGFGKGMGKKDVWGYYEGEELRLTHGTPATMPMYNAVKTVCSEIASIAEEVFR